MSVRAQSLVFMIVGIAIFTISLLADVVGLGANPTMIGWKQYSGAAVGLMIAFLGAHLAFHHVIQK